MGPQGGVPLVLLNRFRGTIDWWGPEFLDYLAVDHDVIVLDNVGVGKGAVRSFGLRPHGITVIL